MVRLRQAVAVEYVREGKIGTDLNLTSQFHGIDCVAMSDDIRGDAR